jgi:hypothetical protein
MRSRLSRLRPTPGVVLGAIAVFFAIGGIGYAAATIGTGDIKDGAVTKAKLHKHAVVKKKVHKNAITSPKVKDHSLKCRDMRFNCPATGATGATGPQGATGPAGVGGAKISTDALATLNYGGTWNSTLNPPNEAVLDVSDGFQWVLFCPATGAGGVPNNSSVLAVRNVAGGNDSHLNSPNFVGQDNNFDNGETDIIALQSASNFTDRSSPTLIYGTNTTQQGEGGVLNDPGSGQFTGNPDCVGSLNYLAG